RVLHDRSNREMVQAMLSLPSARVPAPPPMMRAAWSRRVLITVTNARSAEGADCLPGDCYRSGTDRALFRCKAMLILTLTWYVTYFFCPHRTGVRPVVGRANATSSESCRGYRGDHHPGSRVLLGHPQQPVGRLRRSGHPAARRHPGHARAE